MRWGWLTIAAVFAAGVVPPPSAHGQGLTFSQPQVFDPAAGGAEFLPLDNAANLLSPTADGVNPIDPTGRRPLPSGVRGVVGGFGNNSNTNASVGFLVLVPLWSFRDFQLAVPRGTEGLFPIFGTTGHVDTRFAYVPRISLDYYVSDLDMTVSTSGTFVNLGGRVDRQVTNSDGPSGLLTASANLTLVSATLPEFSRQFAFLELFPNKENSPHAKEAVIESVVDLRIGTRYVTLDQNYTGTVQGFGGATGGTSVATRFSSQSFRGIGLTTAAIWEVPVGSNFALHNSARGSLLFGENRRNSTVSVTAAGLPGFSRTELDNKTMLAPISELETGFEYGKDLAERLRDGRNPPNFVLKVAAVAHYYGGLGPLSAGTGQGFRSNDLFVAGAYVQAGLRY